MSDHDRGDAYEAKGVPLEEQVFGNPLILKNLFKFCTRKELSTGRLVSKLWYYLWTPFWSRKAPIRLLESSNEEIRKFDKNMTIATFLDMYNESFLRTGGLSVTPCLSFELTSFRNASSGDISSSVSQFWRECGPWITKLHLHDVSRSRIEDFTAYKDLLLSKFTPSLKILKFLCSYDPRENKKLDPVPEGKVKPNWNLESLTFFDYVPMIEWSEIFSHYPSLKSLELNADWDADCDLMLPWDREIPKMLTTIADIRAKDATKLRITNLKINVASMKWNGRIELLKNTNLPLEALSVERGSLFERVGNQTQLDLIFRSFQGTLKRLEVRNDGIMEDVILTLPVTVLPCLKELTLVETCFQNMEMLKLTPNLEVLHCLDPWRSKESYIHNFLTWRGFFVDINAQTQIDLQKLTDLRFDYDIGPSTMEVFVRSMPHVKTLAMPLNNETFRIVCGNWKQLNRLTVHRDFLDDDGICGVLQHDRSHTSFGADAEHVIFPNQPCITVLQDLQSFVMENRGIYYEDQAENEVSTMYKFPTRLTERSFVHGFMKLSRLLTLSVTVASYSVPEHLVTILKETIGNVNIVQMEKTSPTSSSPVVIC